MRFVINKCYIFDLFTVIRTHNSSFLVARLFSFNFQSLGQFRIPLYVYKDSLGFPKFLSSPCFAGGATKVPLLLAMYAKQLLSFQELKYVHEKQQLAIPDVNL